MADKGDQQHPQGLTCPLCLEAFKYPTLLRCGHTFCRVCLRNYDQEHNGIDHMECPVCRKRTKLDGNRVAGLSPNFSLQGLQDELHLDESLLQNFCILHKTESRNIFCEVCENFICITCFIKSHQGHKIIKKEDLKEELRKKKISLIQESKMRKPSIEKFLSNAEQQRKEIHGHLGRIEREIRDAFAQKVSTLQENEKELLEKLDGIRMDSDKQLESCITQQRQLIDNIDISLGILEHNTSEHLSDDILIDHHLQCIDLENSLKKPNDKQSMAHVEASVNSKFHCANEKLLDLGHIHVGQGGMAKVRKIQQVKTAACVRSLGLVGQGGKATTSSSQQVKTAAFVGQGGKATTSSSQHLKTAASVGQRGKATTSSSQQVKTAASVGQRGKATTSSSQQVKTAASVRQGGKATTSSSQHLKTAASLGQGGKATKINSQHLKTAIRVNMNADEMQPSTSGNVGGNPATLKNNSLTIVKEAELRGIHGMTALCQNSVIVGNGQNGFECFSVSGEKKPHVNSEGVDVFDIACLTDGRSVVSGVDSVCHIYDAQGVHSTGVQYLCNYWPGHMSRLCSDQNDNIYVVNGNPKIYIFHGSNPNPQRIISTEKSYPYQICVTKTGTMITCSRDAGKAVHVRRSVTVYDREGHVGSSVKSNNIMAEYMYAAVDSQDRVLVARVKKKSNVLRLARYTLQGKTLTKERMFKQLTLPHGIKSSSCYMVSLTPNMIAFSSWYHLYFIKLAM